MGNLDDFFAKKDRKKSKTKKFTTSDELAKKLEDTKKTSDVRVKKERQVLVGQENDESGAPIKVEDEWKDFEEEKKDYTGLKIGHLSIAETEPSQVSLENDLIENNSDGEGGERSDRKPSGPWKKVAGSGGGEQTLIASLESEKSILQKQTTSAGAGAGTGAAAGGYIAPHLRNQTQQPVRQARNIKNRAAPDIHNEDNFPTLSGGLRPEQTGQWGRKKENMFEEVRHGGKAVRSDQTGNTPLSLGNRFNSLADSS